MTENIIEMGTISARGQIAIPTKIRKEMNLRQGEKILFLFEKDTLHLKKVSVQTWSQVTKPFQTKDSKIAEEDISQLLHKFRKKKLR